MTACCQLLADYAQKRSELAFQEIVSRYLNLVYSSALRLVDGDEHRARDVAQVVFADLAGKAGQLAPGIMLGGWLHRHTCFVAAHIMRGERRRLAHEREAVERNTLHQDVDADFARLAPLLDETINQLDEADRTAILLRFFEQKDFRNIGQTLASSEDAARMRVNRALNKLRDLLSQHGIRTTASALGIVLTANTVQAAPAGLTASISAAALAGTAAATSTIVATATKTIAMTTFQKTLVTATVAVLAGAGIYEARQAAQLRDQVQTLQQQQVPMAEQVRQLQGERDKATNTVAWLKQELAKNEKNNAELLKLRGEIGVIRNQLADAKNASKTAEQPPLATAKEYLWRANKHSMNREYEAQLEDLNKAIELDPNLAEAYLERGGLYVMNLPKERGGEEKAVEDYTRCLEIKPSDSSARWNRATHYRSLRQYDKAIDDWTTYITGDTDFSNQLDGKTKSIARALLWRGVIYQQNKKEYSKAIADYTASLQLNPNGEDVHRLRGECYELLGETEKAQAEFAIEPKR